MEEGSPGGSFCQIEPTALIIGAAGFIGSNLFDRFILKGFWVADIYNLTTGRLENIDRVGNIEDFLFLKENVSKGSAINEKIDFMLINSRTDSIYNTFVYKLKHRETINALSLIVKNPLILLFVLVKLPVSAKLCLRTFFGRSEPL